MKTLAGFALIAARELALPFLHGLPLGWSPRFGRAFRIMALGLVLLTLPTQVSAWCRSTTSSRTPSPAEPCVFPDPTLDPPEQYLAWRRPCSGVALSIAAPSTDLSEDEVFAVFSRSIATWNQVRCDGEPFGINVLLMDDRSMCTGPRHDTNRGNVSSASFLSDWEPRMYDPRAFALAVVWHQPSTGEILDVDILVNEALGPYGICPATGCDSLVRTVDLENVITHEMGHYLGLADSQEVEGTMFGSSIPGETLKRDLHADDVAGLCEIYPPGEPSGACDYTPVGGLDLTCGAGAGCCSIVPGRPSPPRWPMLGLVLAVPLIFLRRRRP